MRNSGRTVPEHLAFRHILILVGRTASNVCDAIIAVDGHSASRGPRYLVSVQISDDTKLPVGRSHRVSQAFTTGDGNPMSSTI